MSESSFKFTSPVRVASIWFLAAVVLVPATLALRPASTSVYSALVETVDVPSRMTEIVMLALIAAFGLAAWGFHRLEKIRIVTAFMVGIGIVGSYVLSELIKLVVKQERPCRAVVELVTCPDVGDWSFPSNHTVIAFAVATGIVIIAARAWAAVAYLAAILVGILRILTGAHYPHDVLAGAILGVCVTVGVSLVLVPVRDRALRKWARDPITGAARD